MSTYRERREAKAQRLRDWADQRDARAEAARAEGTQQLEAIPLGQPILRGHHSEKRDRNYRQRAVNKLSSAHEDNRKATQMRDRANTIDAAAAKAIYSDDPDPAQLLTEKITALEEQRSRITAFNASCRKGAPDPSLLDPRQQRDLLDTIALTPYNLGKGGQFPTYVLSNISGRLSKLRKRLAQLPHD